MSSWPLSGGTIEQIDEIQNIDLLQPIDEAEEDTQLLNATIIAINETNDHFMYSLQEKFRNQWFFYFNMYTLWNSSEMFLI